MPTDWYLFRWYLREEIGVMGNIVAPVVSCVVGGVLAVATLMGVITNQTSAPEQSPGTVDSPEFSYGTTLE
jgi:hypothetical protein